MKPMLMRQALLGTLTFCSLFSAGTASASEELFKKSNCLACHAIEQRRVGPSMKEVALKYTGNAAAGELLARKIREGGVGVWGQMPMPPQSQVSEADAKLLAEYILSLK